MTIVDLIIFCLATWRISHFVSNDEMFPFLEWIRVKCGVGFDEAGNPYAKNWFAKQILCQWCNSLWIGCVLLGLYQVNPKLARKVLLPFALSTSSILIQISRPMQYYYK
jgi:hypothetical protein